MGSSGLNLGDRYFAVFALACGGTKTSSLFYQTFLSWRRCGIALRRSADLQRWSEPKPLLEPALSWEGVVFSVTRNLCAVRGRLGFWPYHSRPNLVLWDTLVMEPRQIGMAASERIEGPYQIAPQNMDFPSWARLPTTPTATSLPER